MAKWLLEVRTNCSDPSREKEYNDWYDKIHLPDVMEIPGFIRSTRSVNPDFSSRESGKFLATYEIETDGISKTLAKVDENMVRWKEQGRYSDLLVLVSMRVYRQISSFSK